MRKREKRYRTKESFMMELQSLAVLRGVVWVLVLLDIAATVVYLLGLILPEEELFRRMAGTTSIEEIVLLQVVVMGAACSILLMISKVQADMQKSIVEKLFESEREWRANNFVRH